MPYLIATAVLGMTALCSVKKSFNCRDKRIKSTISFYVVNKIVFSEGSCNTNPSVLFSKETLRLLSDKCNFSNSI